MEEEILHYGTKRHSGRFPYGSGENPFQHDKLGFYKEYKTLKDKGMSEPKIKKYFDDKYFGGEGKFNTSMLRNYITVGREQQEKENITRALYLTNEKQMSVKAAAQEMGIPERTVYSWLDPSRKEKVAKTRAVADAVKDQIERYAKDGKYLDVGKATELQLGTTRTQLNAAISILEDEGYKMQYLSVKQVGTGKNTTVKVLTKDDVEWKELHQNMDKVTPVEGIQPAKDADYFKPIAPPVSIKADRIAVRYAEDNGSARDGMIEIRPGVEDLSLGENSYAQVRIAVDGDHYIKGMAVYSNDIPKGKDILINSNKSVEKGLYGALKPMEKVKKNGVETDEIDQDRPFGATVKRANTYIGEDGKEHQSAINIVNEDKDWDKWSRNLPAQFLSKQNRGLAKRQLQLAYDSKEQEYDDIESLTNPTLKKKLLEEFADSCDSAAVTLKAAPLPRQSTHVLLPLTEIKDNEIYAPNFDDGEEVVLVRFPHEGTFQIPRLKVNNKNKQGKDLIGPNARNAVGISAKTAEQLSGADFDGDTVMVIPTKNQDIKTSKPLKALEGFDTKASYGTGGDESVLKGFHKQTEMGKISNLITDMTIAGAPESDLAMATKYSMTVIDTEKHKLDWRRAYQDCNIAYLKEKYRGSKTKGASTLISRASGEAHPDARKEVTSANDKDLTPQQRKDFLEGKKVYKYTGESYIKANLSPKDMTEEQKKVYWAARSEYDKSGAIPENKAGLKFKVVKSKTTSTQMAEADDAFELSSGTPMETIYANHANKLKALAQKARKEALMTQPIKYSPTAKKTYASEVDSLNTSLKKAQLNNPLERQAQMIANKTIRVKIADDPSLKTDKDSLKKVQNRALADARARVGAKKEPIHISNIILSNA